MKIIGIAGKKRSGKDTFGHQLSCMLPNVLVTSFAKALKLEVSEATRTPLEEIARYKDQYRLILQWWGTEFRRKLNPGVETYWIDKVDAELSNAKELGYQFGIITDVRFPNEANYIKLIGGMLVRVERGAAPKDDAHPSETALDDYPLFDKIIPNDSDLNALLAQAQEVATILKSAPPVP